MTGFHPKVKAAIFDLPGTVLRTEDNAEAHLRLMESLVERYHLNDEPAFLLEKFNARISEPYERLDRGWVSHRETVTAVMGGFLKARGRRVASGDEEWFYREYLARHQSFVRLLPGAEELLEKCAAMRLHLAAVGNMDRDYIEKQLRWLAVYERFDSLTTPEEAGAPLPDDRMLRLAMQRSGAAAAQAVFIGDSVARGITPARALGLTTVLVDTARAHSELGSADFVASSPERVLNILIELVCRP